MSYSTICHNKLRPALESRPDKGRFIKVNVTIEFGKPFYPTQMAPKERKAMYAQLPEIIQEMRDNH